jgi:hypothetical protein
MMSTMMFNMNDKVRVQLTDEGRRIHRANHEKLFYNWDKMPEYHAPVETPEGWSDWQLWDLMHEFGAHCFNGCRVPFATTIEIVKEIES